MQFTLLEGGYCRNLAALSKFSLKFWDKIDVHRLLEAECRHEKQQIYVGP